MSKPQHQPADPHHEQRTGIIVGLTAYFVWGLLTIYWKQLHEFDAFELIGWRITASAVVMAGVLTYTRGWQRLLTLMRDRALLLRVAAAAVLLTINWKMFPAGACPLPTNWRAAPWWSPSGLPGASPA